MRLVKIMTIFSAAALSMASCSTAKTDGFKYCIDEFADIEVIKYRIPGWDDLSFNQKEYIYHLSEAAKWGRDIIWEQNGKYNLPLRRCLERIILKFDGDRETEEFGQFMDYAKRVFFSNGFNHHYGGYKFTPECPMSYFAFLLDSVPGADFSVGDYSALYIIYSSQVCPSRKYQGTDRDLIEASGNHLYEGVSQAEAEKFYADMEDPSDPTPISYGLNSRLVKNEAGKLEEIKYTTDGLYGKALTKIVEELEAAAAVAENDTQRECIALLVDYYRTGDLKVWDKYNIAWVKDTESCVDFINGFIEVYGDPLGLKGNWEAMVNFKNVQASNRTEIISANAQWFEDNSPIDPRFRKAEVKGVSAKVITAAIIAGDTYPATAIGINLPNADWIRRDYGSKSVTIENITEAYDLASREKPTSVLSEFAFDKAEIERSEQYGFITDNLHTDLHECLGHGSGQLLEGTSPNALKEYSSVLEETRADLFALYYLADPKLVELGLLDKKDAFKAEYDHYILNGIFTQFSRIELGKPNSESHMQNRKLIADWCFEKGEGKVIERVRREGKTYFKINDYEALRGLFAELLAEIQRIKSEGDYEAGKNLVEKYAINIDPVLHEEVLERYASLGLKPYRGFVNPDIVPVEEDGAVVDYKVVYVDDFVEQQLNYGRNYSAL